MTASLRFIVVLALLGSASAGFLHQKADLTPIATVITTLETLQTDIQTEGTTEAGTYDTFACDCKDKTTTKSDDIKNGEDLIQQLAAEIESKDATKVEKQQDLMDAKAKYEKLLVDTQNKADDCTRIQATYEFTAADLTKAIDSVTFAINKMIASKPASFLELDQNIRPQLLLAEAMGIIPTSKQEVVSALLQQPGGYQNNSLGSDPTYKFHSDEIISICEELKTSFTAKKGYVDGNWTATKAVCGEAIQNFKESLDDTDTEITTLGTEITDLEAEIATARGNLVNAQTAMKTDEEFLNALTRKCEDKAKEFDQRASVRKEELAAIADALELLRGDASTYAHLNSAAFAQSSHVKQKVVQKHSQAVAAVEKVTNFLQVKRQDNIRGGSSLQDRHKKAIAVVRDAGNKLHAPMLSALAMKMAAVNSAPNKQADNAFKEVKMMIQRLIEKLLDETQAEASKKGFCDQELAKGKKERDFRNEDLNGISVNLVQLEAKKDQLVADLATLDTEFTDANTSLTTAASARATEKADNLQKIADAKKGFAATEKALNILKDFYRVKTHTKDVVDGSSAAVSGLADAGFSAGAYKGKQTGGAAVITLIEGLATDYKTTISDTEAAEKTAAADFVLFDRAKRAEMKQKETKTKLNTEDLETTKVGIKQGLEDLETKQTLLTGALQAIEGLYPMCVDGAMSYAERVKKRDEEMAALKYALCIIDPAIDDSECNI